MIVELNGFSLELSLLASRHGHWIPLALIKTDSGCQADYQQLHAELSFHEAQPEELGFTLRFTSPFRTRLRLQLALLDERELFHLIPGNIHGDNNVEHVRAGEFPCLSARRNGELHRSPLADQS